MENQGSIVILMKESVSVTWIPFSYHGPFASPEERDQWIKDNPLDRGEKYVVEYLSK